MAVKSLDFTSAVTYHRGAFPPGTLDHARLLGPLEDASGSLARYDALMTLMPNSHLLLAPLFRQDAVSSSRMEGTISTIEDVYRIEADEDADPSGGVEARDADLETAQYSRALRATEGALRDGAPFSQHLIRSAHQILLSRGRGARRHPGQYKRAPNYIGEDRRGAVRYVPESPENTDTAMQRLVDFITHGDARPLIRTALAHVEFEAIHPFEDGNGRIGRMLITLMLWRLGILSQPHFFVSGYFETHKDAYVEAMRDVSAKGDWTGWTAFFLTALHEQARENIRIAHAISDLYADMRERFRETLNSQYHDQALDFVFASPVFRSDRFVDRTGIPPTTARGLMKRLSAGGLLDTWQEAAGRRAALYAFPALLDLLDV